MNNDNPQNLSSDTKASMSLNGQNAIKASVQQCSQLVELCKTTYTSRGSNDVVCVLAASFDFQMTKIAKPQTQIGQRVVSIIISNINPNMSTISYEIQLVFSLFHRCRCLSQCLRLR